MCSSVGIRLSYLGPGWFNIVMDVIVVIVFSLEGSGDAA